MIQAARGRNSAVSSGRAWGRRQTSRVPGVVSHCAAIVEAAWPSPYACVVRENAVAQTTKPIASGPAFSCTQREAPD
jgi:hypothetical protein